MRLLFGYSLFSAGLLALVTPATLQAGCTNIGSGASAVTVCISLSAANPTLTANQSTNLTALVTVVSTQTNAPISNANLAVIWSASPATAGTLPPTGAISGGTNTNTFTAPATIASQQTVTITATSQYPGGGSATTTITMSPGTSLDVGSGAPAALVPQFFAAFYRNNFSNLVSLPPIGQVKTLGTSGYVQEFQDDAKTSGVKYALATASSSSSTQPDFVPVVQIYPGIYAFYTSIGATTAGYPMSDTQQCPALASGNTCTYQFFDKSYALFVYATALPGGANYSVSGVMYTEWVAQGALTGAGIPTSAPATITASTATTASAQTFTYGAIYSVTSGVNKGKIFSVLEPIYDLYASQGGPASSLGLPVSETLVYQSGLHVQLFEHGAVQYTSGSAPTIQAPVATVTVAGGSSTTATKLNVGDSVTLTASAVDSNGAALQTPLSWTSSNGFVVSVQPGAQGQTALVTAVGAGSANVTASSGGVTSAKIGFTVFSPCCQVGDGAPAAVQQAFQTALSRNHISVQLPLPQPAVQVGSGFMQAIPASTSAPALLLATAGQGGAAYVVAGALLAAYQSMGGPAGALGFPAADATTGGTQRFTGGALGGSPVRLVTGPILTKWAALGYDAGSAGPPTGDAQPLATFGGNSGSWQAFGGGSIFSATVGPRAGQTYFVGGLILAVYNAGGGASGDFGMPTGDQVDTASLHQQNFEGGTISYATGAASATAQLAARKPAVVVAPATVTAGGQARIAVSGFANNTAITVSITGQPNFIVSPSNGAYSWDMAVPLSAQSATLNIQASAAGGAAAAGTLTIKGFGNNRAQLSKMNGDLQTGAPGALLPVPLSVALRDTSGNPVSGAPVVFQGLPGVQLSVGNAVTDANGTASTQVRMPLAAGTALVTASSPGFAAAPVTFSMVAQAAGLSNFPALQQSGGAILGNGYATVAQKGALLTAAASILLYRQNRGEVGAPNGAVTPDALNQFLTGFCATDSTGNSTCDGFLANGASGEQVVNLWRAAQFTGGLDPVGVAATASNIADLVAQAEPVLVAVALSRNGAPAGGNFVVATGIAADGSLIIQDPNPYFARKNLNDYLSGFTAGGATWQGSLAGAIRFALRSPAATRFLAGAVSQSAGSVSVAVRSTAEVCGVPVQLPDSIDAAGNAPAAGPLVSQLEVCDGALAAYEIDLGGQQRYSAFVTDLGPGGGSTDLSGSAPAAYSATRPVSSLVVSRATATVAAGGIVNAASFTTAIAPGGIISIFGQGLAGGEIPTAVDVDGAAGQVFVASSFQVNALVPQSVEPGTHTVRVQSGLGTAQQTIVVTPVAPAIFLVGSSGAVVNQDGNLNAAANPVSRGQYLTIYATGLGAVTARGGLSVAATPVTVTIGSLDVAAAFAGSAPGYPGLYQVNVQIPTGIAPGVGIPLTLKQGVSTSNAVPISIQ
ncbi:MAG TPA: hypothetical protein VN736_14035 [Candidatus Limnocylindrales bacterium]|nr:hypothetical protein [Candidatus Limnocylindrales bacterium]